MAEVRSGASESCQGRGKVTSEVGDIHGKNDAERASCPGEIPEETDVEQAIAAEGHRTVSCTVLNDLRVAAELQPGQGSGAGWQVIYPEAKLRVAMHCVDDNLQVSVRLRDDISVCGVCTTVHGSTLLLSTSFGGFGTQARKHIKNEETAAEQESLLRKQRQKTINGQLNQKVTETIIWRQKWALISLSGCLLILLGAMVACTVAAFGLATELLAVGLAAALLGLCTCACCGVIGLDIAHGGDSEKQAMRKAIQAAHPELQQFEDTGFEAGDSLCDWRRLTGENCACCVLWVVPACTVAMTVASALQGYGWALAVLWGWVALMMCCGGAWGWRHDEDADWRQRAENALGGALRFPCCWPLELFGDCRGRFTTLLLEPPKRLLDAAVHTTHEHTIVFEGNVLRGRETVCSWPGKYATAWDTLVAGSKQDDISAAVVFLPAGSMHFGLHDPIPRKEGLHGECWCIPLYGESKKWGCRWWSKWIANVELAVSQGCTVAVYYFNGMRGEGKVKDFTTAGEEHLRREAIELCQKAFLKSEGFRNALEGGLKHLPDEKGPDSSSPYSREVHRLFLAWLPAEERQFLVSSEGLGNSQKAEVAWLERKGYHYIEKEVRELESSSPKAIGRATK